MKAIAIKKQMFDKYEDYDGYAYYAATRTYNSIKNSYKNAGKKVKGRLISPVRSCLNYMKALLVIMKLEYIHIEYETDLNTAIIDQKFDMFSYREKLAEDVRSSSGLTIKFADEAKDIIANIGDIVEESLERSPFEKGSVEYKRLKISMMMTMLSNIKKNKSICFNTKDQKFWKMPKSSASYINVFIKTATTKLKKEIMDAYSGTEVGSDILSYLISNPDGEFNSHED